MATRSTPCRGEIDRRRLLSFAAAATVAGLWRIPPIGAAEPGGDAAHAAPPLSLRVGVLKFGTVNWQLDALSHHRLDAENGFSLRRLDLASKNATTVALQSAAVDMIVSDWVWVARQRAQGVDYLFHPYSTALGALVLAKGSDVADLDGLAGKRLGIAGGPLDKSWIVLRALGEQRFGRDLADTVEPVFGAPPLLSEELLAGRIDAALTFWPYAVRLETAGLRRLISVEDALAALGIVPAPPLVGYVFHRRLVDDLPRQVSGFVNALAQTNTLLRDSDEEWQRLRSLMRARSEAEFAALRARYRAGIPGAWGPQQEAAAGRLFDVLVRLGGDDLVGSAHTFDPAMFWTGG